MAKMQLSSKRLEIDKANTTMIIAVSVAVFVVIFSLVASRSLLGQRSYQAKVIKQKQTALKQLKTNVKEAKKLDVAYKEFSGASTNVLGGNPKGSGDKDGENARIVLDALPSKYDFPALATSLNKLVVGNGFKLAGISGTDDEANQSTNQTSASPAPVEMPFTIESDVTTGDATKFMQLFERSIRPIQVQKLSIQGNSSQLKISLTAKTYYQPEKAFNVKDEVVK